MKSLETWFREYASDHQNPTNQKIHMLCVPIIFFSTLGLLWVLPAPVIGGFRISWAVLCVLAVSPFYLLLNIRWGAVMVALAASCLWIFGLMETAGLPLLPVHLTLFVLAWIGQAYGHKLEKKKPSFFTDLAYLLIGPLWVLKKALSGPS